MNFNVNNGVVKVFEILERSPQVRRFVVVAVFGAEIVLALFAMPALIHAVRWW